MAAMDRRESGKEMEMGFASGSVVPLPTANSHAKEEYLMKPAFQKAAFPPPKIDSQYTVQCFI